MVSSLLLVQVVVALDRSVLHLSFSDLIFLISLSLQLDRISFLEPRSQSVEVTNIRVTPRQCWLSPCLVKLLKPLIPLDWFLAG